MKIKAHEIKRPFKLSDVSVYFDIPEDTLEEQLCELAEKEQIFAHDVEYTGDDYLLSQYCFTHLIAYYHFSVANLKFLAAFAEEFGDNEAPGAFLASLYIYGNTLHEKLQTLQIQQETFEINRDIEKDNKLLDAMIEFTPPVSMVLN